jgi:hypothetical protein
MSGGRDHVPVQFLDAVGMLDVPEFRRIAGGEPGIEQIGPRGAVRKQIGPLGEESLKTV